MGVVVVNWVWLGFLMGVVNWVWLGFLMGVVKFFKVGCGWAKKNFYWVWLALDGCGTTPTCYHTGPTRSTARLDELEKMPWRIFATALTTGSLSSLTIVVLRAARRK